MIGNGQYVQEGVFNEITGRLSEPSLQEALRLIYYEGYKVRSAIKKCGYTKSERTYQRKIAEASNGRYRLCDFRTSYLMNNPVVLLRRLDRKSRPLPAKLRWHILCRDNFRCVACGADSQESKLQVDHIVPVSLGGQTIESNLQTLCAMCNMGKGKMMKGDRGRA